MKKILSAILLVSLTFAAQATVFTYENNGFYDKQGWKYVKSDLLMSYDDQTDAFNFNLTQYNAKHDYDVLRLVISDGPMPNGNDLDIAMDYWNNNYTSGYGQGNWMNITGISTFDATFGTNNSYSFSADLTSSLINAGNTDGLYGESVGIWLWGGRQTRHGMRYSSIFDATNLHTVTSSVAEPAPLALLTIALAGLFFARRRRA